MHPKNKLRLLIAAWIPLSLLIIGYNLSKLYREEVQALVFEVDYASRFFEKDSTRPLIKSFEIAEIRGRPEIIIQRPSLFVAFFAPTERRSSDNLYGILYLLGAIFCLYKLWNFDYSRPFKFNLAETTKWLAIFIILFGAIVLIRTMWFNSYVKDLTNDDYYYNDDPFFLSIEIWIGIILLRISQLFKKAESLQKDQELTI